MKHDSMFIQRNETGNIYHLCYTDNTREVISYARFTELLPMTSYDYEDGVYWFRSNFWLFAQPVQAAPRTHEPRLMVFSHHRDGKTEADADWRARQEELADFAATMDAASYRGQ